MNKDQQREQVIKQVILPRRPVKNREDSLYPGGDCGACVTAGLLNLPDASNAYDLHITGTYYGGDPIPKITSWTRESMKDTLNSLVKDSYSPVDHLMLDHVVSDVPIWPFGYARHELAFGMRAQFEFRDHCRAMLNGGYYGVTQVKCGGYTKETPMGKFKGTDHWAMICGWRYVFIPETDTERIKLTSGCYQHQILIGDSAKSRPLETWVDYNDFQNYWGGFAPIWARPL